MTTHTDIYKTRFNPAAFAEVEAQVILYIFTFTADDPIQREAYLAEERARTILEAVRCTAKQIVGIPGYPANKGFQRLVLTSMIEQLPTAAVEAIATFLTPFQDIGDTLAEDYLNTMKTLGSLRQMKESSLDAVQSAATLHGFQGQLVYEWLTAAHYLILAAQATLKDDPRYAREKFMTARTHFGWSNTLAQHYRPDIFRLLDLESA
jgi:hypothetical protein